MCLTRKCDDHIGNWSLDVKKKTERKNISLSANACLCKFSLKAKRKEISALTGLCLSKRQRNLQSARKKCRKGTKQRKKLAKKRTSKWTVSETTLLCHFMVQYQFVKIHKSLKCGIDVHVWLNTRTTSGRDLNWVREAKSIWAFDIDDEKRRNTTKSDPLKLSRSLIFMIFLFFYVGFKISRKGWLIFNSNILKF